MCPFPICLSLIWAPYVVSFFIYTQPLTTNFSLFTRCTLRYTLHWLLSRGLR